MQKNTKIGSITDSCGIVIALVYQHLDGVIDAGDIGETRDMNDLQRLLPKGFAFRPRKNDLHLCENPLGKSTTCNRCLASNPSSGCPANLRKA